MKNSTNRPQGNNRLSQPNDQLAMLGGPPTFPEGPPSWPKLTNSIREHVLEVLDNGDWGLYHSSVLDQLETRLSETFLMSHVTLCASGTIAVELALRGVGVKPGTEVILAGYDFPGNFRAIEAIGAIPVLIDVSPGGWKIELNQIQDAITDKTKAILVSHLHGEIQPISQIRNLLQGTPIKIVEDNCQSPGGQLQQQPLGSLGDVATLSFGGSKLLSAGRGGAVLSNDAQVIQRIRVFSERGNSAFPLSALQAAALLPQLDTLEEWTRKRNQNVDLILADPNIGSVLRHPTPNRDSTGGFYKLGWQLQLDSNDADLRKNFIDAATTEGIAVGEGFRGFAKRTSRRCRKINELPHSVAAAQKTILLHHPILIEEQQDIARLLEGLNKLINHFSRESKFSAGPYDH